MRVTTGDTIHSPQPPSLPVSLLSLLQGNISDHDLLIKLRRVTEFFEQGYSVRVIIVPTGSQVWDSLSRLPSLAPFLVSHA